MSRVGAHGGGVPAWIVTYCDMVTLLICFFIVMATYGGKGARGVHDPRPVASGAGGERTSGGQLVVRLFPARDPAASGSELPPAYADPTLGLAQAVEAGVKTPPPGGLEDSYDLDLPAGLMFEGEHLSAAGKKILAGLAQELERLPYEIQVQAADEPGAARAARVGRFLFETGSVAHTRLGIGLRSDEPALRDNVRLVFLRQR